MDVQVPQHARELLCISPRTRKCVPQPQRQTYDYRSDTLKIAGKAVGVSRDIRVSPHTCRHTFAQMQLKNGLDLYSLSRLMGHSNISITQRYLEGLRDFEVLNACKATGILMNLWDVSIYFSIIHDLFIYFHKSYWHFLSIMLYCIYNDCQKKKILQHVMQN